MGQIYLLQIYIFSLLALSELLFDHYYIDSNNKISIINDFYILLMDRGKLNLHSFLLKHIWVFSSVKGQIFRILIPAYLLVVYLFLFINVYLLVAVIRLVE